ncbi:MAG: hypothetical protein SVV80_03595 [Planctomycetota bacterium]|nr:hypothetical protein [Planctomycetota bacterium]
MKAIPLLFLAGLILLGATGAASASDGFEPPEIKSGNYWYAAAVAIVALAGICVVAFKSSKKTHLD